MGCNKSKPEPQKDPKKAPTPPPEPAKPTAEELAAREAELQKAEENDYPEAEEANRELTQVEEEAEPTESDHVGYADKFSDLSQAAYVGNIDKIKEQLAKYKEEKKDIDVLDKDGFTAVHRAAQSGDGEVLQTLMDGGCDMDKLSSRGETPLHVAVFHRNIDGVNFIVTKCSEKQIEAQESTFGLSPLHVAVLRGSPDIADALLTRGASLDTKSHAGHTPLTVAGTFKSLEIHGYTSPDSRHGITAQKLELFMPSKEEVAVGA